MPKAYDTCYSCIEIEGCCCLIFFNLSIFIYFFTFLFLQYDARALSIKDYHTVYTNFSLRKIINQIEIFYHVLSLLCIKY